MLRFSLELYNLKEWPTVIFETVVDRLYVVSMLVLKAGLIVETFPNFSGAKITFLIFSIGSLIIPRSEIIFKKSKISLPHAPFYHISEYHSPFSTKFIWTRQSYILDFARGVQSHPQSFAAHNRLVQRLQSSICPYHVHATAWTSPIRNS